MANYFATKTAQFKPFSYQEMLAPIKSYQDAYNEADEKLDLLLEDGATKAFNFAPQDTAEKEVYDAIMSKLKKASDSLNAGDVNAFKNIRDVSKEYRKIILPIQQQLAKRAGLVAEQRKALSDNPNLMFTIDYSKANLRDITNSSTYSVIDPEKYKEEISKEFSNITNNIVKDAVSTTKIKGTNTYNVRNQVGYTPEEFEAAFIGKDGKPDLNSPIYQFYKERKDAIYSRKDIDDDAKQKLERTLYNTMKNNAGKLSMSTATAPTTSGGNNRAPQQIFHHYNHNELDKIDRAYYTLGNQVIEYKVLGFEKNEDGTYKKDKSGNYIPILGNKVTKESTPTRTVKTVKDGMPHYDEKGRLINKELIIIYNDGSTEVVNADASEKPVQPTNMWDYNTNND